MSKRFKVHTAKPAKVAPVRPGRSKPARHAKLGGDSLAREGGQPGEIGGPKGPEPTRYGDWEVKGRCIDF